MLRETLLFAGGVAVGVAVIYGTYRYCQCRSMTGEVCTSRDDAFTKKLKAKEEREAKLADLISNQTYVELLTSRELTGWFRESIPQFGENVKMMVVTPTEEHMGGLGYPTATGLDIDTYVVQLIFDDSQSGEIKVLKTRLINFTNIGSTLQAHLIEQDGMFVVTA